MNPIKKNLINLIDRHIVFFFILLFLIAQFATFNYGIVNEEFRDYDAYVSILDGELPYRDYTWIYGPLGPFIYALLFKIFGSELIVLRITAIILGCIGIVLAYRISRFIMPRKIAALSGFLAIASFYIFPSYTYNHYFGILTNLVIALMIFRFINFPRNLNIFIAGLLLNLSFLIHPLTFGIQMLLSIMTWLAVYSFAMKVNLMRFLKLCISFLIGAFILTLPLYSLILTKAPLGRVFYLICFPIKYPLYFPRFLINLPEIHSISGLIHNLGLIHLEISKGLIDPIFFYLLLFVTPATAAVLVIYWIKIKKYRQMILRISFLTILICFNIGYFLYCANYSKTTMVLPIAGKFYGQCSIILFIFLLHQLFEYLSSNNHMILLRITKSFYCALFILFLLFYHSVKFVNIFNKIWYKSDIESVRGIFLHKEAVERYIKISEYIKNNSNSNDKLFVAFYDPAYYILSNRQSIFPEHMYIGTGIPYNARIGSFCFPRFTGEPIKMEDLTVKKIIDEKPKFIIYRKIQNGLYKYSIGPRVEKYIFENCFLSKTVFIPSLGSEIKIYEYRRK